MLLIGFSGCSGPDSVNALEVAPQVTLAGAIDGYSDEQLRREDTLVIDLRLAEEGAEEAVARLNSAGVRAFHIPMGRGVPTAAQVKQLEELRNDNGDRPLLLYCSSGNRAGLLWGAYLIEQGMPVEEAISRVRPIATRDAVQQAIRDYAGEGR